MKQSTDLAEVLKQKYGEYMKEISIEHDGFKQVEAGWCLDVCTACWAAGELFGLTTYSNVRQMYTCQEEGIAITEHDGVLMVQVLIEDRAGKFFDKLIQRAEGLGVTVPRK